MKSQLENVEPIVVLLFVGMMAFSGIVILVNVFWPQDGQLFQVFALILGNFSGAFFTRIKMAKSGEDSSTNIGNNTVVAAPSVEPNT